MPARRPRLEVEELGTRILPSASPLVTAPVLPESSTAPLINILSGSGSGSYTAPAFQSGAGPQYSLHGMADLAGLGQVHVHGSLAGVGFIRTGEAHGTLTFSNSRGSVTVSLTGPTQKAFSPLPRQFSYNVTSATGPYQKLTDQGTLTLVLHAGPIVNSQLTGTWGLTVS